MVAPFTQWRRRCRITARCFRDRELPPGLSSVEQTRPLGRLDQGHLLARRERKIAGPARGRRQLQSDDQRRAGRREVGRAAGDGEAAPQPCCSRRPSTKAGDRRRTRRITKVKWVYITAPARDHVRRHGNAPFIALGLATATTRDQDRDPDPLRRRPDRLGPNLLQQHRHGWLRAPIITAPLAYSGAGASRSWSTPAPSTPCTAGLGGPTTMAWRGQRVARRRRQAQAAATLEA